MSMLKKITTWFAAIFAATTLMAAWAAVPQSAPCSMGPRG